MSAPQEYWRDKQGDVWTLGEDGLMHTPETMPFSREYVEKKWGPLVPTRAVEQWLITAPQETFEAIMSVTAERSRQEEKGWTPEHDDEQGVAHLLTEVYERLAVVGYDALTGKEDREQLVVVAALLVAAIECHDRKTGGSQ